MNGKYLSALLFLAVSALSTLTLLVEAVLQLYGKSICATEGCKVVAQVTRFGDLTMVLLGLGTIALITVLAAQEMRSVSARSERVINFLLVASLAGEGFFVGYQLFRLDAVCVFCLGVFGIFVVLGGLRILSGQREVIAGFGALFAVLSLFYLILPAGGTALPRDAKYILFTSADCKYCSEIRKELDEKKIDVRYVAIKEHAATLKNLGIEHVPTLMVNGPQEKIFLTGTGAIRRHLLTCEQAQPAPQKKQASPAAPRPGKTRATAVPGAGTLAPLSPGGASNLIFSPLPDTGICKEDIKCD
ncbi:MAG: glutaredoxin domain-containing protein [Nitrospirota bacterium]